MATPSAPPSLPSHQTPPQEDEEEEEEEDDDDLGSPRLSAHTLAALQEFLQTEQEQLHMAQHQPALSLVTEDWRLSQFWYDSPTSLAVAQDLHLLSAQAHFPVACIACPSLYVELKNSFPDVKARLFEYDQRFGRYGSDFTFYDYNYPEDLPEEHHHSFQVVVADPPYLSEECLLKTVQTMKLLEKDKTARILLLTGAVQCDLVQRLLGAYPCSFRPSHQNKLGNEFMLFTNYDPSDRLGGWEKEFLKR